MTDVIALSNNRNTNPKFGSSFRHHECPAYACVDPLGSGRILHDGFTPLTPSPSMGVTNLDSDADELSLVELIRHAPDENCPRSNSHSMMYESLAGETDIPH
ncbi:hypothetical protein [Paraburkholderia atlantica]|uniref:hypothetical protein n=1 Tax=Paraburkholderia atlantica TaxID=2654982 RepID=UPI003D250952